jgi:hypothetical protein
MPPYAPRFTADLQQGIADTLEEVRESWARRYEQITPGLLCLACAAAFHQPKNRQHGRRKWRAPGSRQIKIPSRLTGQPFKAYRLLRGRNASGRAGFTGVKVPSKRSGYKLQCSPQSLLRGHGLRPTSMPLLAVGALFLAAPSPSRGRWCVLHGGAVGMGCPKNAHRRRAIEASGMDRRDGPDATGGVLGRRPREIINRSSAV